MWHSKVSACCCYRLVGPAEGSTSNIGKVEVRGFQSSKPQGLVSRYAFS